MLTDEERYRFDLQGFLVRRGVLSGAEVARVHEQIDGLNLPAPGESVQSQRFTGLLEAGGLLRNLVDHDAVLDVVRELCGPQVRLDHAYGIVMAPGTAGLGLHGWRRWVPVRANDRCAETCDRPGAWPPATACAAQR